MKSQFFQSLGEYLDDKTAALDKRILSALSHPWRILAALALALIVSFLLGYAVGQ